MKILIVDDEPDILEFLGYNLEKGGYVVLTATNGIEAIAVAEKNMPDMIILDVMMPEMDGIETCLELRKNKDFDKTIIIFLTARNEDYSQIAGFDAGADDYISKPIKPKVLMSKIKSLFRRYNHTEENNLETSYIAGDLIVDEERYLVIQDGEEIILPRKEFELLLLLTSKPNKVFTREEIYAKIWGDSVIVGDRTIDVHIRKLRERIGEDYITTIKGVGYKFES